MIRVVAKSLNLNQTVDKRCSVAERASSPPTSTATSRKSEVIGRRSLLGAVLGATFAGQASAQTNARALMEPEGPLQLGLMNGRIRACPPEHNCVSTSAREADKYAPAWSAPNTFRDAKDAANALLDATLEAIPDSEFIMREDGEAGSYLRFKTKGKLGDDVMEFYVKNDTVTDRNWDGDQANGPLVLFRSFAIDVKYVYPFMTPIGDLGEQSKRLSRIRESLGWPLLGCELIECFK